MLTQALAASEKRLLPKRALAASNQLCTYQILRQTSNSKYAFHGELRPHNLKNNFEEQPTDSQERMLLKTSHHCGLHRHSF